MKFLKSLSPIVLFVFLLVVVPEVSQAQTWTELTTTGGITARSNSSSILIPQRNEWVVFGGTSAQGREDDVWVLDIGTMVWREIIPATSDRPAPRHTQNAVYDRANDRMLIFSGQGGGLFNDVWAFTFSDSTWTNLSANGNNAGVPLLRYGGVTEWDSLNGHFVTFAGFTTSGRFEDTWTYNPGTDTWTDVSGSVFPDKRCLFNSALAHDRRQMIIYGGQGTGNFNDIWACDMDTYTWTELTPAVSPPGRHFSSVIYRGNGEVVIFGGNGFNQNQFAGARNDVWSFSMDAGACTQLAPLSGSPAERVGHVATYLPDQDKMLIFGGNLSNGAMTNDVWELDFSTVVGVEEELEATEFLVWPNPVTDQLNFGFDLAAGRELQVKVYNQNGELVRVEDKGFAASGQVQDRLDVSGLARGLYFLEVVGLPVREKFLKF